MLIWTFLSMALFGTCLPNRFENFVLNCSFFQFELHSVKVDLLLNRRKKFGKMWLLCQVSPFEVESLPMPNP